MFHRYQVQYACVSHIGKIRRMNQDNLICDNQHLESDGTGIEFPLCGVKTTEKTSLFGIFDGMGGEACGEIASYIAAKDASELELGKDVVGELADFCEKANGDICDYAEEHGVSCMGTTAAMLAFSDRVITLCNIGDSKVFRFCDGILEQISVDHLASAPFGVKAPLSQNLGIPPSEMVIEPYFAQGPYCRGDVYLICSDGLTDMVSIDDITEVLNGNPIEEAVNVLLEQALTNGGKDNTTILLCKIERQPVGFLKGLKGKKEKKKKDRSGSDSGSAEENLA